MEKKVRSEIFINLKRLLLVSSLLLITISWAHAQAPTQKPAQAQAQAPAQSTGSNMPTDLVTLYPDVYSDREKAGIGKWLAENKAIEDRGPIDVQALIKGTLPKDTPGVISTPLVVTEAMVRYTTQKYDYENPVLNDSAYAKKLGYQDIFALPTFAANDDNIMMAIPAEARDKLLVSDLNHSITYYKPIYPGDTLYTVINKRFFADATPKEGAPFRAVCMQAEASIYNQKGEKVQDCIFRVNENLGILKEGVKVSTTGGNPAWVAPAWTSRPAHMYTDKDWDYIKDLWSKEKRQDGTPLYWEDVKIGDEPTWTVDGPLLGSVSPTRPYGMGTGGSRTLKKEIMDPAIFKTMIKDEYGIWVTEDRTVYIPNTPDVQPRGGGAGGAAPAGAQGGAPGAAGAPAGARASAPAAGTSGMGDIDTQEIHKQVGTQRATVINYMGRDIALRHINNYIGDKGWIYNIRWSIMAPSAHAAVGLTVAQSPLAERFIEKVPKLKAAKKVVNAHPLTTDLAIVKSYVYNKFQKDNEYFVDLIWWIENIDGEIWEEGGATVKLPSKNAK